MACFGVATKFRILYFIMLNKGIRLLRNLFILGRGLRMFLAASSTTTESLLLKELDFGLQKPTGLVHFHSLVSLGIDCPGVSLVEVCATCLRCYFW